MAGGAGGAILTGDWSRATGPAGDHIRTMYTTENLLRITFSTVCYFCVFVINMKIDFKELNIISASCT